MSAREWDLAVQRGRIRPGSFRGAVAVAFAIALQRSAGASVTFPGVPVADDAAASPFSFPQAFQRVFEELDSPDGPHWSAHRIDNVARGIRDLALDELSDLLRGGTPFRAQFVDALSRVNTLMRKATEPSRHPEKRLADVSVERTGRKGRPPIAGGAMSAMTFTPGDADVVNFQTDARRRADFAFAESRLGEARLWREAADAVDRAFATSRGWHRGSTQVDAPIEWVRWALARSAGEPLTPKQAEAMVRAVAGREATPTNQQLGTSLSDMLKAKHPEVKRVGRGQYIATEWLRRSRAGGVER
ncbi:hypothetical protein GCM10009762_24840 [Dermacoccus barathri]|uniref:HTH HARE-type domain-containing protein n=2 Tax=Dermacoccus barathri TaxID=322601 RepID=A0ABN2C3Q3_9MICO